MNVVDCRDVIRRAVCQRLFCKVLLLLFAASSLDESLPAGLDEVLTYVMGGSEVWSSLVYPYPFTTYLIRGPEPMWRTVLSTTFMFLILFQPALELVFERSPCYAKSLALS